MAFVQPDLGAALQDRYRLDRELGRGGMGRVWLAEDLKHGRLVALKILRRELAVTLGPERFLREIEFTARLTHPYILPLLDSGLISPSHSECQTGLPWYTMPYVQGESLRARLVREQQLPLADALEIARQVAEALGYAHGHDVLHRDIKPENILLEGGHAVVTDFGIAKALSAAANPGDSSGGMVMGTPAYVSPEQATGGHALDGRSDLYALGCVLYEMLVGQPPFTGASAQAVIARHAHDRPPSLRVVRPDVPPSLEATVLRALAKNPADRPASARELVSLLG
jgi:serine/threonine-protein kinase